VGADLKNAITLVVDGQSFVSQYIGDLDHYQAYLAFQETIRDLVSMYEVKWGDLLVVHDAHPEYLSTTHARTLAAETVAIQHHRAHIASVLAERGEWKKRVLGASFDGTGYGDDGSIWGGEFFVGSIQEGFDRVAHLRQAALPGGDAAAKFPVQAAAGFLAQLDSLPDLRREPFNFPERYFNALRLVSQNVRTFTTTSLGRLFDAAAALLGFTREITFEGQAAMWLEHLARAAPAQQAYPFPLRVDELDFRPLLAAVISDRKQTRRIEEIARAFQRGIAAGLAETVISSSNRLHVDTVVLSGGVFQNELLLEDFRAVMDDSGLQVWTNHAIPPNDGGISLGQAALAALSMGTRASKGKRVCDTMAAGSIEYR
jgi:hydrogenase maturation protein HypF